MNESTSPARPRVAVIGGGVAGIVAAHLLQTTHAVTLLEQGDYLGGHTHTITLPEDGPDAQLGVDTGFIVFNEATYPRFIGFLDELQVASRPTEMSFGLACMQTGLVYAGNNLNGLFTQRTNLIRPEFYRFLLEIGRFSRQATRDLDGQGDLGTLEDYIRQHRFMPFMVEHYLNPMAAAIWSMPAGEAGAFPARPFLSFFRNHGLLSLRNRPRWRTVSGGSQRYVDAFVQRFDGTTRLGARVLEVRRAPDGVLVTTTEHGAERFDQVVIATHADQALRLLADPSPEESRLLGAWHYTANETVLHTDLSVLPAQRRAWACWNFRREAGNDQPVFVTYAMNILQGLTTANQYLVTLNRPHPYQEGSVIARMIYHHPSYTNQSMATQPQLPTLNGINRTFFCGSYFGYGFHEDAVRSSYQAVASLRGNE